MGNLVKSFENRYAAGKILAGKLNHFANRPNTLLLALPRGGVPVAYELAISLSLPLDVFIVRKLGVPGHEELAMGALAMGSVTVFNESLIASLQISKDAIDEVIKNETAEWKLRELKYRGDRQFPKLANQSIILVDDGIATGATMRAAILAVRKFNPKEIIIAVPVASSEIYEEMKKLVDHIFCLMTPKHFSAVGEWYDDFTQTTDEEVYALLLKKEKQ